MNIRINGTERVYKLNMGALHTISEHGYSGEGDEGDFGAAFAAAESGDPEAMRLVAWVGLLWEFQDPITGAVDFDAAPPITITNLMSLSEMLDAVSVASDAFIAQLPESLITAMEKAAQAQETARKAAEKADRPTTPRAKKKA